MHVSIKFDFDNSNWWQYETLEDVYFILNLKNGDLLTDEIKSDYEFIFLQDFEDINLLKNAYGGGNYVLKIKKGFRCDGSSSMTIDNDCDVLASLVHDVLYKAMREKVLSIKYRKRSDIIYRDLMIEAANDIHKNNFLARFKIKKQATMRYLALRLFGKKSAE